MANLLSRSEAEDVTSALPHVSILLDEPQWGAPFTDLVTFWKDSRKEGPVPNWSDINLWEIPELLPSIQVTKLIRDGERRDLLRIFQGARLDEIYGRHTMGKQLIQEGFMDGKWGDFYLKQSDLHTGWDQPLWGIGKDHVYGDDKYRNEKWVSVPLSSDGINIDIAMLYLEFHFREIEP